MSRSEFDVVPKAAVSEESGLLLDLASRAARAAGSVLRERFGHTAQQAVKSSPTDPVTAADREAEAVITAVLRQERPLDSLVGEEGTGVAGTSAIRWVVDPLDGTVNYLFRSQEWSVSIAACDAQGALVGVVFDVLGERMFSAVRGQGAWVDNQMLSCRSTPSLEQALVLVGLDYQADRRREQMIEYTALVSHVRDLRRHASAALELCRVASGRADAYIEAPIRTWDIMAGALIAKEAGATTRIVDLGAEDRGIVAATPGIIDDLVAGLAAPPHGQHMFHRFIETDNAELEHVR